MANWCSNRVVFMGSPEAIEQVQKLFKAMAEKEKKEFVGQLPTFLSHEKYDKFSDIYIDENDTGVFEYETRWAPNIETVRKIAEYYKVDFVLDYAQVTDIIYGRATYQNGILNDVPKMKQRNK